MKYPNRETVSKLIELPNIGNKMVQYLEWVGIDRPQKLIGKDAFALYQELNKVRCTTLDPCVIDVFMSVIHFMEGGEALPWWSFTQKRKRTFAKKK